MRPAGTAGRDRLQWRCSEAKLSAEVVNLRTNATVWIGDADETMRVDARNVNSVVVEMSQAAQKSIDTLVTSLNQRLRAQ